MAPPLWEFAILMMYKLLWKIPLLHIYAFTLRHDFKFDKFIGFGFLLFLIGFSLYMHGLWVMICLKMLAWMETKDKNLVVTRKFVSEFSHTVLHLSPVLSIGGLREATFLKNKEKYFRTLCNALVYLNAYDHSWEPTCNINYPCFFCTYPSTQCLKFLPIWGFVIC